MTEEKKGGMSKGCVVGLIVVGVIALIVILGGVVCWVYKDDIMRMPAKAAVTSMNEYLTDHEVEGVDPQVFKTVSDDFLVRLQEEEPMRYDEYGQFIQEIQALASQQEFTADDYELMLNAMVDYYPELENDLPEMIQPPMEDGDEDMEAVPEETTGTE